MVRCPAGLVDFAVELEALAWRRWQLARPFWQVELAALGDLVPVPVFFGELAFAPGIAHLFQFY